MKVSVIITTILVAQVSASFFDVFHGAVLSVQNSFGKLLSDVVTDVKDTVDCTILAVEHVLSLSPDATTRYYEKCGGETNKTESQKLNNTVTEAPPDASVPKVELTLNLQNNEEYLKKLLPAEIDARINETLSKVLGNYKPYDNVLSIDNVLAKESEQLADVSGLVKKELEKLSNEVTSDLKNIEKVRDPQPSVDTILQEIKVLEKREQNTKNNSEANEIHQVIDQVLGKLDAIEATEANENVKLEEILKDLENNSNNSFVGLRRQFEEWKEEESRHLSEIKSKIEEHEKISDHHYGSYNRHDYVQSQPDLFNTDMNRVDVDSISSSPETSSKNTSLLKETLDNSTSSSTIGDSNNKALIAVANEVSPSPNNRLNDSELNDVVIKSNSYSTTDSPIGNEVIHPFQRAISDRPSDLSTLSINQSATAQNNRTGDNTNVTVANTTLSITDSVSVNETIQPVDSIADSDKQQLLATIEPTSTDKNNQSVIMSNTVHTSDATTTEEVVSSVNSNMDSGKVELSDFVGNNDTIMERETQTVVTEMTITSHNNNDSNDTVISRIANAVVANTFVNGTSSGNESLTLTISTLANTHATYVDIESNGTMITSTSSSINFSTPVNETMLLFESSTAATTVETKIDSDHDYKNTMLPTTFSPISESTMSENIRTEETALSSGKDQSTAEWSKIMNDTTKTSTSLTKEGSVVSEANQIKDINKTSINEESSTVPKTKMFDNDSSNTMITNVSLPIVENTLISENTITSSTIEPKITGTNMASSNDDSLNGLNETIVASTLLPIKETALVTEVIQPKDTASGYEEFSNGLHETIIVSTSLPVIERAPATETIQRENMASGHEDSSNGLHETIIVSTSLPIIESAPVTETIQPKDMASGNENSSNGLHVTIVASTSLPIIKSAPATETIQPRDKASVNEDSSNGLHETMIVNTSLPIIENVPVTETVQPKDMASGIEHSSNGLNETIIASILLPIIKTAPVNGAIQPKETSTSSGNDESSIMIKSDSNTTLVTSDSSPTVENTSVSVTIKPEKSTTASGYKELTDTITELTTISKVENVSNSDTTITSTLTPNISLTESENIQGMSVSATLKPEKTTTASDYKELTESTTISKVENEKNSDTTKTSTLTPIIARTESENIQGMATTTVSSSKEESLDSTATETPKAEDDDDDYDDSIVTVVTSTAETIPERKPEENYGGSENDETFTATTNPQVAFPASSKDADFDNDAPDDDSNENIDDYDTVKTTAEKTNSAVGAESNKIDKTTTSSEEPDLRNLKSAKHEIVTTRSRIEKNSGISPKFEANTFSRTPDMPDLNHLIRSLPLTITENPPVNREWLTPNKLDQQNYNTNLAPINNYDLTAAKPLSDRLLQTRQPLINPEEPYKMPIYDQVTMPTITFDEKLDQAKAFAIFDALDERLRNSDSPFGPDENIPKTVDVPLAPVITNAPTKLIDPGRINVKNPYVGPTAFRPIRPLNSFDDRTLENTYRPQGLTTHRPRTGPLAHSYKNPPMDYDSFFHTPPRNSEAHQRALQEARQLMANSKRSDRIINNIMKNKNKFNARSIFR